MRQVYAKNEKDDPSAAERVFVPGREGHPAIHAFAFPHVYDHVRVERMNRQRRA